MNTQAFPYLHIRLVEHCEEPSLHLFALLQFTDTVLYTINHGHLIRILLPHPPSFFCAYT